MQSLSGRILGTIPSHDNHEQLSHKPSFCRVLYQAGRIIQNNHVLLFYLLGVGGVRDHDFYSLLAAVLSAFRSMIGLPSLFVLVNFLTTAVNIGCLRKRTKLVSDQHASFAGNVNIWTSRNGVSFLLKPISFLIILIPEGCFPINDWLYTHPLSHYYISLLFSNYTIPLCYSIISSHHHYLILLSMSNIPIHGFKLGPKTKHRATKRNDSFRGNRFETLAIPNKKNVQLRLWDP